MAYSPISANSALIISKVCTATSKSCFSFVYSTSVSSSTYILKSFAHKISTRTAFSLSQRHLGWPATPNAGRKFDVSQRPGQPILPTQCGSCLRNWKSRNHFPIPERHTTMMLWNPSSLCSRRRNFTAVLTDPRLNCERRSTNTFFSTIKNAHMPLWTIKHQSNLKTHSLENTKILLWKCRVRIPDFPPLLMLFSTVCKPDVQIRTGCLSWQILWNTKALFTRL